MLRVIRSTVQAIDIDTDLEDAFDQAIEAGITMRETYSTDSIGQKEYRIQLLAYTDPTGAHRWAVTYDNPSEADWQDTRDLTEAITLYEQTVRDEADGMGERYEEDPEDPSGPGELKDPFDSTDVPGVRGYEAGAEESGNNSALVLDAKWWNEEYTAAKDAADALEKPRRAAIAAAVDAHGRGGQTFVAKALGIGQPTVNDLARRGRAEGAGQPHA